MPVGKNPASFAALQFRALLVAEKRMTSFPGDQILDAPFVIEGWFGQFTSSTFFACVVHVMVPPPPPPSTTVWPGTSGKFGWVAPVFVEVPLTSAEYTRPFRGSGSRSSPSVIVWPGPQRVTSSR